VEYTPTGVCTAYGSDVKILYEAPPEGSYKVCGSLSVKGSRFTDSEKAISLFKEQARQYGANAVFIIEELQGDFNWAEGYNKKAKALAIQLNK
jgi:hypothetical protein